MEIWELCALVCLLFVFEYFSKNDKPYVRVHDAIALEINAK